MSGKRVPPDFTIREFVDFVKEMQGWEHDKNFAEATNINTSVLSKMMNGPHWQKHFHAFRRIFTFCEQHGIDLRIESQDTTTKSHNPGTKRLSGQGT